MNFASLDSRQSLTMSRTCDSTHDTVGRSMLILCLLVAMFMAPLAVAQSLTDGRPELAFELDVPAGDYTVRIQDLSFPAPIAAINAAIIEQTSILGQLEEPGEFMFTSSGEPLRLQVFALPDNERSVGTLSVEVTDISDVVVLSELGTVSAEVVPGPAVTREYALTLAEPQDVQVALNDLLIPQGFDALGAFLFASGGNLVGEIQPGQVVPFTLPAGDYRLLVAAEAPSEELGGTLSVDIVTDMDGEVLVADVVQVGTAVESERVELDTGSVTLSAFDAAFPSPLSTFSAVLVGPSGMLMVDQNAPSLTEQIEAGVYTLLTYATPGQPEGGTFGVDVKQQDASVGGSVSFVPMTEISDQQIASSFALDTPQTIEVSVSDFGFPSAVPNLTTVLVGDQGVVTTLTGDGAVSVDLAPGTYNLLTYAGASDGTSGLFSVQATGVDGELVFDSGAKVVGAVSESGVVEGVAGQTVTIDLIDIGFPARFAALSLAVTRGDEIVGFVFGEGSFSFDVEQSGDYTYTLIATPDAATGAGLYDIKVTSATSAPPPPSPPSPPAPTPPTPPDSSGGGGATSLVTCLLLYGVHLLRRRLLAQSPR